MVDHVLSSALAARNLARVSAMRRTALATPCPSCLSSLRTADHRMRDEGFKAKVNALLDEPCQERVECKSILQVLIEDVGVEAMSARAVRRLAGLVAAPYYGCLMTRPPEIMTFDDTENPTSMDRVIEGLGAAVAPFPLKTDCCGASLGVPRREIVLTLSGKILAAAESAGANVVIVACPLCHMNLDLRRDQINAFCGTEYTMPVLYITQLIGLALGLERAWLGLDLHAVDPNPLLDRCFNAPPDEQPGADETAPAGRKEAAR
jgi:heterodisulfide reductase subunit B